MAQLIQKIQSQLNKEGLTPRTNQSRQWLMSKVSHLRPTREALLADRQRLKNTAMIGRMYFYYYDPKTKDRLPYYDRFPLVIPIERYPDGFLGLNLHYLPPQLRMVLLDKLSEYANNRMYDEKTRLRLSYQLLFGASRAFEATPCLKRYLFSHIQSRFLEIEASEWDIAATLPVESFEKSTKSKIWNESRKKF